VELDVEEGRVDIRVEHEPKAHWACPKHGVRQVAVPWAGKHSRFTLLMERLIIDTLRASQSVSCTATLTGTKYLWLRSKKNVPEHRTAQFEQLKNLK